MEIKDYVILIIVSVTVILFAKVIHSNKIKPIGEYYATVGSSCYKYINEEGVGFNCFDYNEWQEFHKIDTDAPHGWVKVSTCLKKGCTSLWINSDDYFLYNNQNMFSYVRDEIEKRKESEE